MSTNFTNYKYIPDIIARAGPRRRQLCLIRNMFFLFDFLLANKGA